MKIKVVVNTWLTSKGGADDTTEAVKIYGNDECTTCNKREEVKKKKKENASEKKKRIKSVVLVGPLGQQTSMPP